MANNTDKEHPKKAENPLNNYAKYSSIVIQMIVIIGIGTYAGIKLDENSGNGGSTYTLILSLVSVFLALFFVIRKVVGSSNEK